MSRFENLEESVQSLKDHLRWESLKRKPAVGVVLGSGLGAFVESLQKVTFVDYRSVKHMPKPTVAGHGGKWAVGETLSGIPVLVAMGRFHYYEGHGSEFVTLPIQMMKELRIQHVIMTNATGSVNPNYKPGEFMLIRDQLNLMGRSPLVGLFGEGRETPFVDMSHAYDRKTNDSFLKALTRAKLDVVVHTGVYCGMPGPQYETPSEIQMIGRLGGDVVGMSTVPEVIMARYLGMTVSGLSSITNFGSGLGTAPISHQEVAAMGAETAPRFSSLVNLLIDSQQEAGLEETALPIPPRNP